MQPYIQLIRPVEWIKNVFVFAALVFAGQITNRNAILLSVAAFVAFCLASSAGYVLNDVMDRGRDRLHPTKKDRPIASGAVSISSAMVLIAVLLIGCAATCYFSGLPRGFWITVSAYLALTWSYSLALKHRMLLDVIVIAVLFVLRAIGGAKAISVDVSPWLQICTFMLCLFLGFGKRRCEIGAIQSAHALRGHRPTLVRYTPHLLTHLLSTSGGIAIVTFLLYTLDSRWPSPFEANRHNLIYTLPLVVYGVFRYAMLVESEKGGSPTEILTRDIAFALAIVLWIVAAILILYKLPADLGLGVYS